MAHTIYQYEITLEGITSIKYCPLYLEFNVKKAIKWAKHLLKNGCNYRSEKYNVLEVMITKNEQDGTLSKIVKILN